MPRVWKQSNSSANEIHYEARERERGVETNDQGRKPTTKGETLRPEMKETSRLGQNQRSTSERVDHNDLTPNPNQTPQGGLRTKNDYYARVKPSSKPQDQESTCREVRWITRVE